MTIDAPKHERICPLKREHKELYRKRARNIFLTVAYDGTEYHGFQRQNNAVSVQSKLEAALSEVFGDKADLTAAGRTDAGVHAAGQAVNFFTDGKIPLAKIPRAVNAFLPKDIAVLNAKEVGKDFSALHDAKSKVYVYTLYRAPVYNPLICRYAWHVERPLDAKAMKDALLLLRGEHDFSSFKAASKTAIGTVRTLYDLDLRQSPSADGRGETLTVTFHGNGFLYHMVRNIMGSLVYVGCGRFTPNDFAALLAAKDRTKGAPTAPAAGLCLKEVRY